MLIAFGNWRDIRRQLGPTLRSEGGPHPDGIKIAKSMIMNTSANSVKCVKKKKLGMVERVGPVLEADISGNKLFTRFRDVADESRQRANLRMSVFASSLNDAHSKRSKSIQNKTRSR